ncbi:AraC family transcriptional regulator [Bermanella sp. WJH001]|uniref:AraC family transcriptional regulator n=1 Tax=Bermanella sp. WJH001 TaxID=3048005 RepID=UPI0024BECAF3|nr:AraC family transcriptional regulator [Bermanella sp. WJH001]MDJ1537273.1 AraC family transcriptional regulator [Bermanella sp. WJH001]
MRDASILLRLVHEAMLAMNVNVAEIYQQCGITLDHIEDKKARLKHRANTKFWQVAEAVTGDHSIGLHVAEHVPLYRGQVLEYLFLSSQTFGDGLNRALNYQRLLSDVAQSYLDVNGEQASLVFDTALGDEVDHHFIECIIFGVIRFFKSITQDQFSPSMIQLIFDEPSNKAEYERVFQCSVEFNRPKNVIVFPSAILEFQSQHAEPDLIDLHQEVAQAHVEKIEKQDLVYQIRQVLSEHLDKKEVSLELVAQSLGLSPRSLRSQLSALDTSFNQVLSEYRTFLAKRLLERTQEPVEEICYLLGFSEVSAFYRAFKRWTGMTPIEYRKTILDSECV